MAKNMIFDVNGERFEVNVLNRDELSNDLIQQWEALEKRSIEGNAYLSPHFVLPAIKYLTPSAEVILIFITHISGNARILTGVGAFEFLYGSKRFPLPHLRTYHCLHSYLGGLLVDEEFADTTLLAFFKYFGKFKRYCCGVEFTKRTGDTILANKIDKTASHLAIPWYKYNSNKRSILIPNKLSNDYVKGMLSGKLKKNIRYGTNVLSKTGEIRWKVVKGQEIDKSCIDRFLKIEHMGWKRTNGTSLLSKANEEAFFREMIENFAKNGRAFFTELTVHGRTIASTANLLSGKSGYAFKIGWDPEFTTASPGILNEVEFVKNAGELFPDIEYFDSGAEEGSFIERLWPDKSTLVSGIFLTKSFVKPLAAFLDFARRMKHRLCKLGK